MSRWRIELPPENNRFDLDSLSDLVIHLNYTPREGGEPLRRAAGAAARGRLPGAGVRLFDVRRDLPDAWARLHSTERALPLLVGRAHFPYLPFGNDVRITGTELFFEVDDADERADHTVRLVARHETPHGPQDECRCPGREIDCVASPGCRRLYRGVLDLPLGPLGRTSARRLGEFRFSGSGPTITRMFIACGYETVDPSRADG